MSKNIIGESHKTEMTTFCNMSSVEEKDGESLQRETKWIKSKKVWWRNQPKLIRVHRRVKIGKGNEGRDKRKQLGGGVCVCVCLFGCVCGGG